VRGVYRRVKVRAAVVVWAGVAKGVRGVVVRAVCAVWCVCVRVWQRAVTSR